MSEVINFIKLFSILFQIYKDLWVAQNTCFISGQQSKLYFHACLIIGILHNLTVYYCMLVKVFWIGGKIRGR